MVSAVTGRERWMPLEIPRICSPGSSPLETGLNPVDLLEISQVNGIRRLPGSCLGDRWRFSPGLRQVAWWYTSVPRS